MLVIHGTDDPILPYAAVLKRAEEVNVFVADMSAFPEMNKTYLEFFPGDPPARIVLL